MRGTNQQPQHGRDSHREWCWAWEQSRDVNASPEGDLCPVTGRPTGAAACPQDHGHAAGFHGGLAAAASPQPPSPLLPKRRSGAVNSVTVTAEGWWGSQGCEISHRPSAALLPAPVSPVERLQGSAQCCGGWGALQ